MERDERELIEAFRGAGDREALAGLFARHQARVHALACSLLRDPHEAEDLTQEVFLRTFDSLHTLGDPAAFRAWITRLTVRLAIDRSRSRRSRAKLEGSVAMHKPLETSPVDPLEEERREELHRALDELSDEDRMPLVLRYHHNLSL